MKRLPLLLALAIVALPGSVMAETYRISILPRFFPDRLTAMMTPLAEYLRTRTGLNIELMLTKDFAEYEKRLTAGEIAIGIENPLVYTRVAPRHQAVAMVREFGEERFRGIVIVRPESAVAAAPDLQGTRVMIVGETSAGGYLSQKLSLMESGIRLDTLTLETAADNRQENVILSVSVGDVDAGFIRESALHAADRYILPGSIKQAFATAWLPGWAVSFDTDLPEAIRARLAEALFALPEGSPVLQALEIDRFIPANDADYDPIRQALGSRK